MKCEYLCVFKEKEINIFRMSFQFNADRYLSTEDNQRCQNISPQTDKYFSGESAANMIALETYRPLQKDEEDECLIRSYADSPRINCFKNILKSPSLLTLNSSISVENINYHHMSSSFEPFDRIQSPKKANEVSILSPDNEQEPLPLNEPSPNGYTCNLRSRLFWLKQTIIGALRRIFRQV